jgi:hypothetical protein
MLRVVEGMGYRPFVPWPVPPYGKLGPVVVVDSPEAEQRLFMKYPLDNPMVIREFSGLGG